MKTMRFVLILLLVSAVALTAALAAKQMMPKQAKVQGQMVCMWCDCVATCAAEVQKSDTPNACMAQSIMSEPHKCMAVLKSNEGKVYTLLNNAKGRELLDIKMHEQKVEVEGCVMPNSQILSAMNYRVVEKVEPVTPEDPLNWFYF